jgi:hypothetical protein
MRYLVLVNLEYHWDHRNGGGFNDMAFKSTGNPLGASIILEHCGVDASGTICAHIDKFYPGVGGRPAVFWRFDDSQIDAACWIEQTDGGNNDDCHHEIKAGTKNALNNILRRYRKAWKINDLSICDGENGERPLTQADIPQRP